MKLFLTSSIGGCYKEEDGSRKAAMLDGSNDFVEELRELWHEDMRCLLVASDPQSHEILDSMASIFGTAFSLCGLPFSCTDCCDDRRPDISAKEIAGYGLIILCGGHVPTQNAYFKKINLAEKLEDYDGIVIGISAGTMNCAGLVYAMPELEGESLDPNYRRFITGLGLSSYMIIPHYDVLKDDVLDGKRCIEEIALPDSNGREFIALTDGSYILISDGKSVLHGEAYAIRNGSIRPLCGNGQYMEL